MRDYNRPEHQEINNLSYDNLGWILNYSDEGFFLLIASEKMQEIVVYRNIYSRVAILDCAHMDQKSYSYLSIEEWISANPGMQAYFLLHFDSLLQNDESIAYLNFSRDMLADLDENIIFCILPFTDDRLNRSAIDFYSFVKLKLPFEDERDLSSENEKYRIDSTLINIKPLFKVEQDMSPGNTEYQGELLFTVPSEL